MRDWPAPGLYEIKYMPEGWNRFHVIESDGSKSHRYLYVLSRSEAVWPTHLTSYTYWQPYRDGCGWEKTFWWDRVIWNFLFPTPRIGVDF